MLIESVLERCSATFSQKGKLGTSYTFVKWRSMEKDKGTLFLRENIGGMGTSRLASLSQSLKSIPC